MSEELNIGSGIRRGKKSATAFRTISEVSSELEIPTHVLRFWESKFSQVRPLKRGGGRRYYRPEDIELLQRIKTLLYDDGYTIRGAQKFLRASSGYKKTKSVTSTHLQPGDILDTARNGELIGGVRRKDLVEVVHELENLRDSLRGN